MNAELIAVGTEILLGEIVNTDAQVISQGLSELGINVYYQTVVGDNPERLERAVREAKDRADIIITTGGLGPTLDDLTKETLAKVFGKKMMLHQPSLDSIREFFQKIGREMTPNNEKQAWLPEGCTVFDNPWGCLLYTSIFKFMSILLVCLLNPVPLIRFRSFRSLPCAGSVHNCGH